MFSNLGLKTPLDSIIGWYLVFHAIILNAVRLNLAINMNEINLKQFGFTYSVCGPFTKNKERIQKLKETGDTKYIYRNELDKACFQHGIAYGEFKDLARRTASDKVLRNNS